MRLAKPEETGPGQQPANGCATGALLFRSDAVWSRKSTGEQPMLRQKPCADDATGDGNLTVRTKQEPRITRQMSHLRKTVNPIRP